MDQNAMLAAIADAYRRKNAGEDPESTPSPVNRIMPPSNPDDLKVAPPKPDPEMMANAQINGAARPNPLSNLSNQLDKIAPTSNSPSLPAGMSPEQARTTINPATGLPYSVASQQSSPEQDDRNAQAAMRLKYLQQMAAQGK